MGFLFFLFALFIVLPIWVIYHFIHSWRESYEQEQWERECRLKYEKERQERERIYKEQQQERARQFEQARLDRIRSEILMAFSAYPWDTWPVDAHNGRFQSRRMDRAYNSDSLKVLSFTPHDYTARVQGEHEHIYSVDPQSCNCPDFKKRLLPCKHMYFLALTMFKGFDDSTFIGERHNVLTSTEESEQRSRKYVEKGIPHKNILKFLQSVDLATMREILDYFSTLDESDIRSAVRKLYSIGSISRKKQGRIYYYFIPTDDTAPNDNIEVSFSPIVLPKIPKFPVVSQPYRCYTNFGIYEVHGINPQTGKSNKRRVIALDTTDAYRSARVIEKLMDPITVQEVPLVLATERQIKYATDLGHAITDELSRIDVSALIDRPCSEGPISEDEWIEACESRMCISSLLGKSTYKSVMSYHRDFFRYLDQ